LKVKLSVDTKRFMLKAENIRLRAVEPGDIDLLYDWENDPEVWHVSNTLAPYSRYQIEQYVLSAGNDVFGSRQLRLIIDLNNEDNTWTSAGSIDLFEIDPLNRRAGVGILIAGPFRNQGIASHAIDAIITYAADTLMLHQLYCNISEDNLQSIHIFEKAGFNRCGEKQDWLITPLGWKDEYLYQLFLDSFTSRA
jgi:diamine N-acetyltransferase